MAAHQPRLGQLLVDLGFVDAGQLEAALKRQKTQGGRLGKLLVQNAVITEDRLVHALSRQLGIDTCDPVATPIHERVKSLIPRDVALRYRVLPIARKKEAQGEVVYVTMADPLDQPAMEAVRNCLGPGVRVHWMLSGETEMEVALHKHWGEVPSDDIAVDQSAPRYHQGVPVVHGLPLKRDLPARGESGRMQPEDETRLTVSEDDPTFDSAADAAQDFSPPFQAEAGLQGAESDFLSYEAFQAEVLDDPPEHDGVLGSADLEEISLHDDTAEPLEVSLGQFEVVASVPPEDLDSEGLDGDFAEAEPIELEEGEIVPLEDGEDEEPSSHIESLGPSAPPAPPQLDPSEVREPAPVQLEQRGDLAGRPVASSVEAGTNRTDSTKPPPGRRRNLSWGQLLEKRTPLSVPSGEDASATGAHEEKLDDLNETGPVTGSHGSALPDSDGLEATQPSTGRLLSKTPTLGFADGLVASMPRGSTDEEAPTGPIDAEATGPLDRDAANDLELQFGEDSDPFGAPVDGTPPEQAPTTMEFSVPSDDLELSGHDVVPLTSPGEKLRARLQTASESDVAFFVRAVAELLDDAGLLTDERLDRVGRRLAGQDGPRGFSKKTSSG
ncbi:MAG: hypothetical protein ACFB9M_18415 [Myxococcota bacterium]